MPNLNALRRQNRVVLIKIETTEGTDAAPVVASDAIMVDVPSIRRVYGIRTTDSQESTGSLDDGKKDVIGAPSSFSFRMKVRGPGATITGSVRPNCHPVLRACGMKDTLLASIASAALTAGTATTGTLGTGFSSTAQDYRGAPLRITASGTAARVGATPVCVDYTAGKVATFADTFSPVLATTDSLTLDACVVYRPTSVKADWPSVTVYDYEDGRLHKFVGMRGNAKLVGRSGDALILDVTLTGTAASNPTDASVPTQTLSLPAAPLFAMQGAVSSAALLDRLEVPISGFEWDMGVRLTSPDNPNTFNGFDAAVAAGRQMALTCDPLATLVATRNAIADAFAGTTRTGAFRAGTTATNRVVASFPALAYTGVEDVDRDGLVGESYTFQATGADAGGFLAFS